MTGSHRGRLPSDLVRDHPGGHVLDPVADSQPLAGPVRVCGDALWLTRSSCCRTELDQTTVFDKPTIVTIAEGWDDPSEPSFPLGSVPCVAIWEDGGRAGLALKGLRDAERAVPHAWDHMQPFQEQTPMVDAMNYRRQSAPGRDAGAAPQQWVTVTCPALFAGEYRRQGPAGQTGAMSEFNAVFLHEVVRALGIPIDDPELFFYLLPKTFRFYGSVFQ